MSNRKHIPEEPTVVGIHYWSYPNNNTYDYIIWVLDYRESRAEPFPILPPNESLLLIY